MNILTEKVRCIKH